MLSLCRGFECSNEHGEAMMSAIIVGEWTLPAFLVIFLGYVVFSSTLQVAFYYYQADQSDAWKVQPHQKNGLGDPNWWFPAFRARGIKKEMHPLHKIFATVRPKVMIQSYNGDSLMSSACSVFHAM
jgi:hypothetical protein